MNKKIVAFGEIMLRLSPTDYREIKNAQSLEACYGGTESNVLAALSAWGNPTEYLSVIPQNDVGEGAILHLRRLGVGTRHIARRGDALGIYFLEFGFGERPSKVIYHRRHSAVTTVTPDDFDMNAVFENCSLFHVSGISLALSETCRNTALTLAKEAKGRGIPVSFDFNYRAKLLTTEEASPFYREIMPYVDICFGNLFDLATFLGIEKETPEESVRTFFEAYRASYLCYTEKKTVSSSVNERAGVLWTRHGEAPICHRVGPYRFDVLDRIGGGDSFTAGILHYLNQNPEDVLNALRFGTACTIMKHAVKGDVLTISENDILAFLKQKSKEVQR